MQSRWVIIVLVVALLAAAVIVGVWWFSENEDQVDPSAISTGLMAALAAWPASR